MKFYVCLAIGFLFISKIFSQSTYIFVGNGDWSADSNWVAADIPPEVLPAGSEIYIAPSPGGVCILNTSQVISPGATLTVLGGARFLIIGGILSNPPVVNTVLISSVVMLDTSFPAPSDTVYKFEYRYDTMHRVVKFLELHNHGTYDTVTNATLIYNGTAQLPYKAIMYSNFFAPSASNEIHYFLFSNSSPKKLVYDSTIYTNITTGNTGLSVTACSYYPDSVVATNRYYNNLTNIYRIIKENGNTVFQDYGSLLVSHQRYDSNPNPLFKLKFLMHEFYRIGATVNQNHFLEFEPNNLSEINDETNTFGPYKLRYNYTFNNNGYPNEARIKSLSTFTSNINKIKYFYTN